MYSQHNEDDIILRFFGNKKGGRFLDVGAFDGKSFSNTRMLFERGWGGVCVEASPRCFLNLQTLYRGVSRIKLVCAAIHEEEGCSLFYDNGGAVATLVKAHMEKWKKPHVFEEMYVATITPKQLLKTLPGPYDFLSLDIEGHTNSMLNLFPSLKSLGLKLVCVEAYDAGEKEAIAKIMGMRGYKLYAETVLNVFYEAT